jgi:choline dehydrogenase-like flavoprotein
MLPRELGGVDDPQLLVYGTENVRVVDASVLPTQVSGHLTSILYAVAERAADLVKERWGVQLRVKRISVGLGTLWYHLRATK